LTLSSGVCRIVRPAPEFVGETLWAALEALAVAAPTWQSGLVTAEWAER
jgi:hypothetical protein